MAEQEHQVLGHQPHLHGPSRRLVLPHSALRPPAGRTSQSICYMQYVELKTGFSEFIDPTRYDHFSLINRDQWRAQTGVFVF